MALEGFKPLLKTEVTPPSPYQRATAHFSVWAFVGEGRLRGAYLESRPKTDYRRDGVVHLSTVSLRGKSPHRPNFPALLITNELRL